MKKVPNIKKIKCVIFQSKNEVIERITKVLNTANLILKAKELKFKTK